MLHVNMYIESGHHMGGLLSSCKVLMQLQPRNPAPQTAQADVGTHSVRVITARGCLIVVHYLVPRQKEALAAAAANSLKGPKVKFSTVQCLRSLSVWCEVACFLLVRVHTKMCIHNNGLMKLCCTNAHIQSMVNSPLNWYTTGALAQDRLHYEPT